jgi:ribosomal-protein-alanine N-acetyltransferase
MSLNLTEFSWWHVAKAHEIDKSAFNATAWSLATFWSELTQRNRYYLALVDEKKEIVGFGGVAFNGVDADIQTMVIKPEYQKKGYGKQLLDALLEKVKEHKSN